MSLQHQAVTVSAHGSQIHGFRTAVGVANFLGIRFGHIDERFCPAGKLSLAEIGPSIDATKWGPRCPQQRNHGRERRGHLYEGQPASLSSRESERDCLNLNIFSPESAIDSTTKLPVLVWIHGGGWVFGDGGIDYDGNSIVAEAIRLNKPFIFVTINYRLGYYGFLSSRELEQEAAAEGRPYMPNLGLHDQRLALEWVQTNIGHFAGDKDRVTVAGQSAGAWSALSHLVADQPVCHRGIIMSATVIEFETAEEKQSTFDHLVQRAGVSVTASSAEKLQALRGIDDKLLTEWLDGAVLMRPSWDSTWFKGREPGARLDQVRSFPTWVEGLMIGSTKDETAAIAAAWRPHSAETIRGIITSVVPDQSLANDIMRVYAIDSGVHEEVVRGVVELTTESFFGLFPPMLGDNNKGVGVYRFDQMDTFQQSPWKGHAYHCLDLPFLTRTPPVAGSDASPSLKATSNCLSSAIIESVSGKLPWEVYEVSGTIMVFDGESSGPQQVREPARWRQFFDTPARAKVLVDTGRALMTYRLDKLAKK